MSDPAKGYQDTAEAAWRWVLAQVRWDEGPWIPESVPGGAEIPEERDQMYSGIGGLAYALAEVRESRAWTDDERVLAEGIAQRVSGALDTTSEYDLFNGVGSHIGVVTALALPGYERHLPRGVSRLQELATPDGWPSGFLGPPWYLPNARINDATLGTASVLLAAIWVLRHGVGDARPLAEQAADILLAEGEQLETGTNWLFVSKRFKAQPRSEMPNFSHGVAGIAAALAVAGLVLERVDLVNAARAGAAHLITLGIRDAGGDGFIVPSLLPHGDNDYERVTYTWCHGAAGTSLLFAALDHAGVPEVAGESPMTWHRRCLTSVLQSGIPERRYPGFWDNDGRCCGTAGVGDILLDSWQRGGDRRDLDFALTLADAVVDRAVVDRAVVDRAVDHGEADGPHAWWSFREHRAEEPQLPPGVGWMQGAAGIAAFLFRTARVLRDGAAAPPVPRMDTWWATSYDRRAV